MFFKTFDAEKTAQVATDLIAWYVERNRKLKRSNLPLLTIKSSVHPETGETTIHVYDGRNDDILDIFVTESIEYAKDTVEEWEERIVFGDALNED